MIHGLTGVTGANVDVVDNDGRSLLHYAVGKTARAGSSPHVVETLLSMGVQPDFTDANGQTPLHYAASKGVKAVTQALINVSFGTSRFVAGLAVIVHVCPGERGAVEVGHACLLCKSLGCVFAPCTILRTILNL